MRGRCVRWLRGIDHIGGAAGAEAEVGELDVAVGADQEVVGLDVPEIWGREGINKWDKGIIIDIMVSIGDVTIIITTVIYHRKPSYISIITQLSS